jgi:oligoendopeptidase F
METQTAHTRWQLTDLLADPLDQSIEEALAELDTLISELEGARDLMTHHISEVQFNELLNKLELVNTLMGRLSGYAHLWVSEDTQNQSALNLRDRLDQSLVALSNRVMFFDIWFKDLPDEIAARLISGTEKNKYFLESLRRFKPYTLSEVEEQLLNIKDINGIDALVNLYEMITNRFMFNLEVDGELKTLTRDSLSSYYFSASADLRKAAYQEFYRVYTENATILAQIYSHRVRDWFAEGVKLRGYSSPISARNLANDVPDEVVETLLAVCRKNAPLFQNYFQLKANWLGMKKLRRYDIYAPLSESNKVFTFDQATEMVMDSFTQFSPQIAQLAKRVFDEQHLDPFPRHGKRGGAFCSSVSPELTPWVLVNFDGQAQDIPTLAHELGHAVHSMLASEHSIMCFHAELPLAETASVFAEMIMTGYLLERETDPAVRRDLMLRTIDDAYINVIRQSFFTLFEQDAHRMLVEGCSFEELADHYLVNLSEQFGDAVELSDEFRWEWVAVPHFFNDPFYTYAYSFGQLLVLSLYQQYRLEGASFIPRFIKILSYGGSESPTKILSEAGLDITSANFWQGGFDVLNEMLTELIKIA